MVGFPKFFDEPSSAFRVGAMETVFVVLTHIFNPKTNSEIARISSELSDAYPFMVYYDASVQEVPAKPDLRFIPFDYRKISALFPFSMGPTVVPGNLQLVFTELLAQFPNALHFWIVEYDVRYSGNWKHFVKYFESNPGRFVGCNIRFHHEEQHWHWWESLKNNADPENKININSLVRAFLPISRYSRRALEIIRRECLEGGWAGHYEVLVPSLLHKEGLQIEEIGGDSHFTPPSRKYNFYSATRSNFGDLQGYSSMRWRPEVVFWGLRQNRLYHPVKGGRNLYGGIFQLWRFRIKRFKKSIIRRIRW